jgi:hypothetical protein
LSVDGVQESVIEVAVFVVSATPRTGDGASVSASAGEAGAGVGFGGQESVVAVTELGLEALSFWSSAITPIGYCVEQARPLSVMLGWLTVRVNALPRETR